jgi:hypothetical protein
MDLARHQITKRGGSNKLDIKTSQQLYISQASRCMFEERLKSVLNGTEVSGPFESQERSTVYCGSPRSTRTLAAFIRAG